MNYSATVRLPVWLKKILSMVRWALLIICVIGLGTSLGFLITSPAGGLTVALIGIFVQVLVVVVNPLGGLLLWLTLYPFSERVFNINLGAGIPDLSPTRIVIILLFAMILAQAAIGKRTWPRLTKVDWATIAFSIAILISALVSDDPVWKAQYVWDKYLVPLVIVYFLVKNLVTNRTNLDKVLRVVLFIAAYSAVYIIFEQMTSNVIQFGDPPDQTVTFQNFYVAYTDSLRLVQGLYDGPHTFGLIFTMSLPIAFYYMFSSNSQTRKAIYLGLIGLMFVGLILTYKRAAWFSVPLSFLVIQFFYPKFRRFFLIMLVVFGTLIAVTWNQLNESAIVTERFDRADLETGNGRTDIWAEATDLWKQRPIFGHGFGEFDGATENFYLAVLVSAGVIGLIPYLLMLIFVVTDSINLYRQAGSTPYLFADRELIAVFWGAFLTYVMKSYTGNQASFMSNVLFAVLIGAIVGSQEAALALARHKNKERQLGALET